LVQVFHFKVMNSPTGKWEIPPSKRTAENITALSGVIIPDTMAEVDPALIDGEGRYFPPGAAVQVEKNIDKGTLKRKPK
jgi:hypothetical protein